MARSPDPESRRAGSSDPDSDRIIAARPDDSSSYVNRLFAEANLERPPPLGDPTGAWTTQAARNLFLHHADQITDARALVRDGGSQLIATFDEIFRTEGLKILKTPFRTPVPNSYAERWIGSIRRELLDRTIIWNQHQLERLVMDYTCPGSRDHERARVRADKLSEEKGGQKGERIGGS